jgi:ABC-type phosphate transport system substrate-binding protein
MRRLRSAAAGAVLAGLALSTALAAVALAATSGSASAPRLGFQIIRNPNNPIDAVDRQFLEDAFLKKKTTWPGGGTIRPVDLAPASTARRQFSDEVLRRPVAAIRNYWQQRIFAGSELPPPELETDAAVIRFVLRERGAVGYVSNAAAIDGAKVLIVK